MQKNAAFTLLLTTLGLIALGLVMLASTSSNLAASHPEAVYGNLRKQCVWLFLGGISCIFLSRTDYQRWLPYAPYALGLAAILLGLCLVPGIGRTINGSPRWIGFGTWFYQPSEFAKVALAAFLAWWLGEYIQCRSFLKSTLIPIIVLIPILALVAREKDLGATAILLAISISIFVTANVPLIYLSPVPIFGVFGIGALALFDPVKLKRIQDWAIATANPSDTSNHGSAMYQQLMGLIALGSGGIYGLGLGNSLQKYGHLPEANTDFVFAIIGEEMGLIVTLLVVFAFLMLCLSATWISIHAPDPAGMMLGVAMTTMLTLQALMNLAVVTELMPCKGLPLPFISYGGSNLLTCLVAIGILFNIQRQGVYEPVRRKVRAPIKPINVRM